MSEADPLLYIEVEVRSLGNLVLRTKIPYVNDQWGGKLMTVDRLRLQNLVEDILHEQMHLKERKIVSIWDDGTGRPLDRTILIEREEPEK